MGVDGASTQLIFFIAASVVALGAVGVMATTITDLGAQIGVKGQTMGDAMATDIVIINDPAYVPVTLSGGTYKVTVYVKNTGNRVLDPTLLTVFFDGRYVTYAAPTFPGDEEEWAPGVVVEVVANVGARNPLGDHSIRVVTDGGRFDDLRFNR